MMYTQTRGNSGQVECKAQPAISSISPNNAKQGQQNVSVTLTGQFTNWARRRDHAGGPDSCGNRTFDSLYYPYYRRRDDHFENFG